MIRVPIRPEQIYTIASTKDRFWIGGREHVRTIPWTLLRGCHLYARTEIDLHRLLADAASSGYMILDGFVSERRGLRGFVVGIGAWGSKGKVECRGLDSWGLASDLPDPPEDEADVPAWASQVQASLAEAEQVLRAVAMAFNEGRVPFAATASRWVRKVYQRCGAPMEPEGGAMPLPTRVAELCRRAHVGGPIVHVRSSLDGWVSLDRDRAFGQAMLRPIPTGNPVEIPLSGHGLHRWKDNDLMDAIGFAHAEVHIPAGPLCPLLPLHRPSRKVERSRTLYPTGTFSGDWTLGELAQLERSGLGEVRQLSEVYTFPAFPIFRPVIEYIRAACEGVAVKSKRLEHLLYGACARGSSMTRIASAPSGRLPLARDCFEDRVLRRVVGPADIRPFSVVGNTQSLSHGLFEGRVRLVGHDKGTMDRPDRAAWITAQNRIEMSKLLVRLDEVLRPARPHAYVGRIYVDGIDIEADPAKIPTIPGVSRIGHGPSARLYRANAWARTWPDGRVEVEGGSSVDPGACEEDLRAALRLSPDVEGGPLAEGRSWPLSAPGVDARDRPRQQSEPLHIDASLAARFSGLGFDPVEEAGSDEVALPV